MFENLKIWYPKYVMSQLDKEKRFNERISKVIEFSKLPSLSIKLKSENKKIVFVTGSFNLLNPGHCRFLSEAKALGDILVVGVSTDESDYASRGIGYPIINSEIRAELVSHLIVVDYVTFVDEENPVGVLSVLKPDIFYVSERLWNEKLHEGEEEVVMNLHGGKIITAKKVFPHINTQAVVDHVAHQRVFEIFGKYLSDKFSYDSTDIFKLLGPLDYELQKPSIPNSFAPHEKILEFSKLFEESEKFKKEGKKVVFVSGSYDLLHVGHARFIEQASLQGDILFVGIPSDRALNKLKGYGRPIVSQYSRALTLGHLDSVDRVFVFDSDTVYSSIETLKPDIFFTVLESWNLGYKESPEYKLMKELGGDVVTASRQAPFTSASLLLNVLAQRKVKEIFEDVLNVDESQTIKKERPLR